MFSFIKSLFNSLVSFESKDSLNSTNQTENGDHNIQITGDNNNVNLNTEAKTQQHDKNNPSVEISDSKISGEEILTESDKGSAVEYGKNVSETTPGTSLETGKNGKMLFRDGAYKEQKDGKVKISTKPKI